MAAIFILHGWPNDVKNVLMCLIIFLDTETCGTSFSLNRLNPAIERHSGNCGLNRHNTSTQCWPTAYDISTTLDQQWVDVSRLLE